MFMMASPQILSKFLVFGVIFKVIGVWVGTKWDEQLEGGRYSFKKQKQKQYFSVRRC